MRPIKFRLFTNIDNKMLSHEELMLMPVSDWIDHPGLMQFTGLHDKNGKEIWEGDICAFGEGGVGKVVSGIDLIGDDNDPGYHGFLLRYNEDANYLFEWDKNRNVIEVLGNIYENPELLK